MHPFFLTITMRAVCQIKRTPEFPFNMLSPGFSLRLKEKSGLGELSWKKRALVQICNPVGTEAPGGCMTESSPSSFPWLLFWPLVSHPWAQQDTNNPHPWLRIQLIPRCQLWKPLEEIHIGIQTPEHLAKPNPAGLCMLCWPPLQPQPTSPRQWPALPLLDKHPLCPLTYSTQMSKHALAHHYVLSTGYIFQIMF